MVILLLLLNACNQKAQVKIPDPSDKKPRQVLKPGAGNSDTLVIKGASVVFFQPDSLQNEKIRSVTREQIFESMMHEYTYQIKNGHMYLKKNWPQLAIIDTKGERFLLFKRKDGSGTTIDLDTKDPSGMILFDGTGNPKLADMMNIDTEVPVYFSNSRLKKVIN